MEIIRKYKAVIGIVVLVLVLVFIRLSGNGFMPDAEKWATPSFDNSNIITPARLKELNEALLIRLDNSGSYSDFSGSVRIDPGSVLERKNLRMIRSNKGPVILFSEDTSVSAGVWMSLSQMGIRNIYVLSGDQSDEIIKNKFLPDTLTRQEL